MHSWEVIDHYCQFHPRWFENADRYVPDEAHLNVYKELIPDSWRLRRGGIWFSADPPGERNYPDQGWKLHISASSKNSAFVLRRVLPIVRDLPASFKFLIDPWLTFLVNGKLWPRGSSGKFITIYPSSMEHFLQLGQQLTQELDGLVGPYILSDRRWPKSFSVYYRYGGIRPRSVLQVDGRRQPVIVRPDGTTVPDVRTPYWQLPDGVLDPFPRDTTSDDAAVGFVGAGRFSVKTVLSFSNRGGVYEAYDKNTGEKVILKEARPGVEVGRNRIDAISVLEKEYRLLQKLAATGYTIKPIAYFREWEHAFLAEEFVPGEHIGLFTIRYNPLYRGVVTPAALDDYLRKLQGLWLQIACAIAAAHSRGVILGDISFTNIMLTGGHQIRIIDLEAAVEKEIDPQVGLYTPGISSREAMESGVNDIANDYHCLGALIFGSIMLANGITGFYRPALHRFLQELRDDLALGENLIGLIEYLMNSSATDPPEPDRVINWIEHLEPFGTTVPMTGEARLALPAAQRLIGDQRDELSKRVAATVGGIVDYLQGTADVTRSDRVFPADLMVFETNPLSIAYGASGVLYALQEITGEIPRQLTTRLLCSSVTDDEYPPGLYIGQAGIAWVLAQLGYMEAAIDIMRRTRHHELLWHSTDVLYGSAGYGLSCLKLWAAGAGTEFLDDAVRVGAHLFRTLKHDQRGVYWRRYSNVVPLGYSMGGSGIALFLLYLHLATGCSKSLTYGRRALDFELANAGWQGDTFAGFPAAVAEKVGQDQVLRQYWDAGSAGVGTTLIRYLAVAPDESLNGWVPKLASDVSRKYAVSPQLFHGLSGLGNFLLDLWEYIGDDRYLAEAWQVAEGVLLFQIVRPEGISFPGEQAMRESADLATGAAGVGLFLHRLLHRSENASHTNFNFVVDELIPQKCDV